MADNVQGQHVQGVSDEGNPVEDGYPVVVAFEGSDGSKEVPNIGPNGGLLVEGIAGGVPIVVGVVTRGAWTDRSGTITAGGAAQSVAPINANRSYIFIMNISTDRLWINFGATAVQNQPSILLEVGAAFVLEANYIETEAISIIGPTTGQAFTAKEG